MKKITPPQLIVLGYLSAIFIGAFLLTLPVAVTPHHYISFIDALFTAASSVCVTGLVVVDTGSFFSGFGQCVILFLLQIGGLGIMTISTAAMLFIGKRLSLRERVALHMGLDFTQEGIGKLVKKIIILVISIEGMFSLWLFTSFGGWQSTEPLSILFKAVFHTVSAFCNAGFSTMSDSFMSYSSAPSVLIPIMLLIVIGGLGFIVILDITKKLFDRKNRNRLGLQARVVLLASGLLILGGFLFFFFTEATYSMRGFSLKDRVLNALFHSVTSRTAGFNSIDVAAMNPGSNVMTLFLMFIGASPGSTGGGIKTCTFVIILFYLIGVYRNQKEVFVMKRMLPRQIVREAILILLLAFGWIFLLTICLSIIEKDLSFLSLVYEAFSAFGTVGLSFGITSLLSPLSKLLIIITMLIGRTGPLILILAVTLRIPQQRYTYPEEKMMVG